MAPSCSQNQIESANPGLGGSPVVIDLLRCPPVLITGCSPIHFCSCGQIALLLSTLMATLEKSRHHCSCPKCHFSPFLPYMPQISFLLEVFLVRIRRATSQPLLLRRHEWRFPQTFFLVGCKTNLIPFITFDWEDMLFPVPLTAFSSCVFNSTLLLYEVMTTQLSLGSLASMLQHTDPRNIAYRTPQYLPKGTWIKKKKRFNFHMSVGNPGLSRDKWVSFWRNTQRFYKCLLQEGMFYDPPELGIALLSGSALL